MSQAEKIREKQMFVPPLIYNKYHPCLKNPLVINVTIQFPKNSIIFETYAFSRISKFLMIFDKIYLGS